MDGADSQSTLNRPAAIAYDSAANEVFVADSGNHRIVVFDADKGTYKRHWFAYGEKAAGAAGDIVVTDIVAEDRSHVSVHWNTPAG